MLVRCAYYEGTVPEQHREAFDRHVETVHMQLVAKFPRIHALRLLRGQPYLGEAPKFYQVFELYFKTLEDLDVAMASEERKIAREDLKNFRPWFQGEIHHVNYEIKEIPVTENTGIHVTRPTLVRKEN